jgi:hypothetical protein
VSGGIHRCFSYAAARYYAPIVGVKTALGPERRYHSFTLKQGPGGQRGDLPEGAQRSHLRADKPEVGSPGGREPRRHQLHLSEQQRQIWMNSSLPLPRS